MSDPQRHQCAIADFTDSGDFHAKTLRGEHLIISLGPAQIVSLKRQLDRYVAHYDAEEAHNGGLRPAP